MIASYITSLPDGLLWDYGKTIYSDKFLIILSFGSIAIRG